MEELTEYKAKCKRGINDLQSEYAFHGASQGDDSRSNEIKLYKESGGWMIPNSSFKKVIDITDQEAIYKHSEKIRQENIDYVNQLYKENRFGEEYEVSLKLHKLKGFDDTKYEYKYPDKPLTSHRFFFISQNDINKKTI